PNHTHGIVWFNHIVGAPGRAPLQGPHLRRAPKSLGSFIAGYKSMVTKRVNETRQTPGAPIWQRNYYEHIVRNETELNRIREYIRANPLGWHLDRENPQRRGTDEFDRWLEECARSTGI
ncbi:MAG: transposase, partial [bacterium]